jgi:hypothetical protein
VSCISFRRDPRQEGTYAIGSPTPQSPNPDPRTPDPKKLPQTRALTRRGEQRVERNYAIVNLDYLEFTAVVDGKTEAMPLISVLGTLGGTLNPQPSTLNPQP